ACDERRAQALRAQCRVRRQAREWPPPCARGSVARFGRGRRIQAFLRRTRPARRPVQNGCDRLSPRFHIRPGRSRRGAQRMRIDKLEARALTIPFKSTFRHAAAERATTQALWVSASGDGFVGYGEGCPREYVTGESLRTAAGFVSLFADEWRSAIRDLQTLRSWAAAHEDAIGRNPAAWCAVELALLDLIGK